MYSLVGVAGYEFVGKDTVAKILVNNYAFERMGLADALKDMAYSINPDIRLTGVALGIASYSSLAYVVDEVGWDTAKKEPQIRKFLQRLGSEGARNTFGEDCWIKALEKRMYEYRGNQLLHCCNGYAITQDERRIGCSGCGYTERLLPVVVPDIRYPNEAKWVRDEGGLLIWVNRPGFGPVNSHASAAGLVRDMAHTELNNDAGELELAEKVRVALLTS